MVAVRWNVKEVDVKVNFLTTNDIPRKGELQVPPK